MGGSIIRQTIELEAFNTSIIKSKINDTLDIEKAPTPQRMPLEIS